MSLIGKVFKIDANSYKIEGYEVGQLTQRKVKSNGVFGFVPYEYKSIETFRVRCTQTLASGEEFLRMLDVRDVIRFANLTYTQEQELKQLKRESV